MKPALKISLAAIGLLSLVSMSYWLGVHNSQPTGNMQIGDLGKKEAKILYYRNPMGLPDTSTVPKKDSMGMDYLPVYEEGANPAEIKKERKLLYYRNPMGLPDTSKEPKQDSMGMDYLPVYEGEDEGSGNGTVV